MIRSELPRDFWLVWASSTASNLGDGVRLIALPLLAVTLTDDPVRVAAVTALTYLPWLLVGPVAGTVVDRVDRRKLMVAVQLTRGVVAAGFAVAVATGNATIWALYATTVVIAIGETLADPAAQASVPRIVSGRHLEVANGRLVGAEIVTNDLVGSPLGAGLFALGTAVPFATDAGSYLVAALLLLAVRADLRPVTPGLAPVRRRVRDDVVEGVRYVVRHDVLRPLTIAAALSNLGAGASGGILVLFVVDLLALSEITFGLLLSVGAAGGLLGATVSGRLVGRLGRRSTMLWTSAVGVAATAALAFVVGPIGVGATLTAMFAATAAFNVVSRSVRQAVAPDHLLGRVITSVRLVGLGAVPVGALAGGVLARVAGLRAPLLAAAVAGAIALVVLGRYLTQERIEAAIAAAAEPAPDAPV